MLPVVTTEAGAMGVETGIVAAEAGLIYCGSRSSVGCGAPRARDRCRTGEGQTRLQPNKYIFTFTLMSCYGRPVN